MLGTKVESKFRVSRIDEDGFTLYISHRPHIMIDGNFSEDCVEIHGLREERAEELKEYLDRHPAVKSSNITPEEVPHPTLIPKERFVLNVTMFGDQNFLELPQSFFELLSQ